MGNGGNAFLLYNYGLCFVFLISWDILSLLSHFDES